MIKPRICIVTARNIFDSPCLDKYQKIINEPFDIVYWDRRGIDEFCGALNYYKYTGILSSGVGKLAKAARYFGFWKYVNRHLKKHQYEKLIVFPTQAAWLIGKKLKNTYKGKYILDIRDYAGEFNPYVKKLTDNAVNNSGLCSVTSPAYQAFLPQRNYLVSHNVQAIDDSLIKEYRNRKTENRQPIVLSFIGTVRFIDQQKKLISRFMNDNRFALKFIGSGSEQLESYCKEHNVQNVELVGRFERKELPKFYMDTDMAINIYGSKDPYLDYALSNKLYSAAIMGMPILVSPDTYMAEITEKYGFGYAVDPNDPDCADKVYEYFRNIHRNCICDGCDAFMKEVEMQEASYKSEVQSFLES